MAPESVTLLSSRGTIFIANSEAGSGKFVLFPELKVTETSIPLIRDILIDDRDIVAKVACLDDMKVIYSFGKDFGSVTIMGECLLGSDCKSYTSDGDVADYFEENRISNKLEAIAFSIAGARAYDFYLTGLQFLNYDPEYNILPFILTGAMIDSWFVPN